MIIQKSYNKNEQCHNVQIAFGTPEMGTADFVMLKNLVNYTYRLLRNIDYDTPRERLQHTGAGWRNLTSTLIQNPHLRLLHVRAALLELIKKNKLEGLDTRDERCNFYLEFVTTELAKTATVGHMRNFVSDTEPAV